jgi:hypothetical protein
MILGRTAWTKTFAVDSHSQPITCWERSNFPVPVISGYFVLLSVQNIIFSPSPKQSYGALNPIKPTKPTKKMKTMKTMKTMKKIKKIKTVKIIETMEFFFFN